ncbi:Kelch repeat-containing protein [Caproiciproducens faecalis]|uniref:Kelch motif protein n=1 Tax=Caproiciproducens faecalis TaxID=2820301 RepID=A0ABS7DRJ7_9FIRM|nr:kelch repeat-containing protein [Caproiciproducens faecalis]MBW7573925.1 hypothetical protein [Caproiciproducens faecalis]
MIINTAQGGGGSDLKLNVLCQPDLPTDIFDGVLLQTASKESIKKVVFDSNVWAAEQWQNPSLVATAPISLFARVGDVYDNKIFIFSESNAYSYDPALNTYATLAKISPARSYPCCATYGDKIFIFGGFDGDSVLNTAIVYNPASNTFGTIATMSGGVRENACCAVYNDEIFIFGGLGSSASIGTAIAYKPSTNTYRTLASMPETRGYACCATSGNEIFIFGGFSSPNYLSSAIAYNPSTNTYRSIAAMSVASANCGCVLVGDEIFIFGGRKAISSYLSMAIAYNPSTNTYRNLQSMNTSGYFISAFLYADSVYVSGASGTTMECLELTAKQYADSPSVIFYRIYKDTTLTAELFSGKVVDGIPVDFKNCMLFKDGNITFPALYLGDGTQWNLARSAQ